MAGRLQDRVILITGAASGIGRATVLRAVAEGACVGTIDNDEDGLREAAEQAATAGGQVAHRCVDVSDTKALTDAIAGLADELGAVHGVFANAGVLPPPTPADSLDPAEWDRVLAVNLTGAAMTLMASLPYVANGGSLLVNGSSLAMRPRKGRLAYVAAKAGIHAVGRALAVELAPRRIRVNVIAPGLTDTPMVHAIPGHVETGLSGVPLGELVRPDEVAALAVHLWSDDAQHLTGAVLNIDGGRTAG